MEKARGRVVVFAPTGTQTNRPCGRLSRRSWNNSASHADRECGRRGMPLSLCRESRLTAARHGAFWVLCPSSGHNNGKKRPKELLICITYSIGYDFYAEALIPVEALFNTASPRILLLNIPNFQPTKIPEEPFLIKSPSLMEKKLPGGCQGTSRPEPRGGKQKRVFFTGRAETDSMILCCWANLVIKCPGMNLKN